jgi:hypothetical protein
MQIFASKTKNLSRNKERTAWKREQNRYRTKKTSSSIRSGGQRKAGAGPNRLLWESETIAGTD